MEQTTWKGTVVKPLSEQLSELAARVKTAEDILAAANQKDRAALESQREQLKSSINKAKDQGKTRRNDGTWLEERGFATGYATDQAG
jgi:hypothetical protein